MASEPSLLKQWLSSARGEDTTERRQQAREEHRRFHEAMRLSPAERAAEASRARDACAAELANVFQCESKNGATDSACEGLSIKYFQCYRRHRGFLRTSVAGFSVDMSPYVALKSEETIPPFSPEGGTSTGVSPTAAEPDA
eukprot:m.173680 g.173680  ORF g.173680 m.173680 type:complete len:141 (-) comp24333_c0_seq4:1556-1978(-)